jgi:hypothetical protein
MTNLPKELTTHIVKVFAHPLGLLYHAVSHVIAVLVYSRQNIRREQIP